MNQEKLAEYLSLEKTGQTFACAQKQTFAKKYRCLVDVQALMDAVGTEDQKHMLKLRSDPFDCKSNKVEKAGMLKMCSLKKHGEYTTFSNSEQKLFPLHCFSEVKGKMRQGDKAIPVLEMAPEAGGDCTDGELNTGEEGEVVEHVAETYGNRAGHLH